MDTPQPPPVASGVPVTEELLLWIDESSFHGDIKAKVKKLISDRSDFGLKKYGQCLMSDDGRNDVIDAMQEAGDLIQYAYKAKLNGKLPELRKQLLPLMFVLNELIKEESPEGVSQRMGRMFKESSTEQALYSALKKSEEIPEGVGIIPRESNIDPVFYIAHKKSDIYHVKHHDPGC